MSNDVHEILESHATDFEVGRTLHDVPPHEVYEIEYEGRRAVCKISQGSRGAATIEGRVLRHVDRETTLPVPEVLAVGSDWFVAEYREDAPAEPDEDAGRLDEDWLRTAGRALGQLHEETAFDRPGLFVVDGDSADPTTGLQPDADGQATWSDALDDLLGVYHDAVRGTEYHEIIADARNFLDAYADRFEMPEGRAPVLIHGWFSPGHVAVDDGKASCLIDFEHSLAGSGEWDYWRAAVPLFDGPGWEKPPNAEALFRSGYESVRSLPSGFADRADAYRAFVAASHLDSLHVQRGIDDDTREMAEFLRNYISETLDELRAEWE